ncbi:nicotinate phosphoribosyltransferase [Exiguobacterium sp. 17-1]|uniref:nicotinate phosphoribosyltransferase n=1 Tax=Exiguobacterium sp. 17-1 TaxID=2931981 RepID=UPI001FFFAA1F|nr:nicotinate phosphoribosyltransferase [Exiguobacterium sp. 17-1]MCK2158495.1 nicotinate phosphoribosyltransferase [Exiguobacterium sp. 17-1]
MLQRNLALHTDLYLPRWMYIYWQEGRHNERAVFDVYYRSNPFEGGYVVFAGLENIIEYVQTLRFTEEDITYLQKMIGFPDEFKDELRNFKFSGSISSVKEGEIVFPNEPLVRIEARIFEAKLLQTAILNIANHESLIATKYARIRQSAPGAKFLEAGARRAQGIDAAYFGTRASYLAGFDVTSLASAGRDFGIPCGGTMEHADIQFHDDELTAFRTFAAYYPDQATLLVDTYDTLKSGLPNAIIVAKELEAKGHKLRGIRIDSGDLSYLSKRARTMLDEAGFPDVDIVLSGDLDEYVIQDLRIQGAQANTFLVGTRGITAYEQPALGMVYKLVAREVDGELIPVIKVSSSKAKTTTPHIKEVYRIVDRVTNKFKGDYVTLLDEDPTDLDSIDLIDVRDPSFRNRIENFNVERLLTPIFVDGELIYSVPTIEESRQFHEQQIGRLWEEYKRLRLPEVYAITFSDRLWKLKLDMIRNTRTASGLK